VVVVEGCVAALLASTKTGTTETMCQLKSPNHAEVLHETITTFKEVGLRIRRQSEKL
jgi:hypothetical protein